MVVRDCLVRNFKLEDTRIKTIGFGKSDKTAEGGSVDVLIYPEGTTAARSPAHIRCSRMQKQRFSSRLPLFPAVRLIQPSSCHCSLRRSSLCLRRYPWLSCWRGRLPFWAPSRELFRRRRSRPFQERFVHFRQDLFPSAAHRFSCRWVAAVLSWAVGHPF